MTVLPVEIIFVIIADVYYKDPMRHDQPRIVRSRQPDYKTLSACSLVHSSWRAPCQSLLFNHITETAAPRLAEHILMHPNLLSGWDALLEHTRILEISLHNTHTSAYHFRELTQRCTNLYELEIRVSGIISMAPILAPMKTPPSSRLRALRVMECSSQSPILYELLVFFPTIEFLATGIEIVAPPPKVPAKFKLYELTMFRTLTPEIFSWLLANSLDTLRIVELRDLPSAEVTAVLVGCGHQLQSFRAMKYHTNTAKIVQSCTNLQELVILGIPSIPPFTIQRLPLTLEHLSLVHSHSDPSVGIADMMMLVKNSSKLKLLSCDGRFKRDPLYGVFHDICMKKGIEVESSEYGLWPNEEPVKAFNFPRGRTMMNLRAMN